MNKIIAGLVVAILIGSGAVVLLMGEQSTDETVTDSNAVTPTDQTPAAQDSAIAADEQNAAEVADAEQSAGQYVQYSDAVLADTSDTDRILFFHAEWCSTCKFFEGDIKSAGIPEGITIIEANYDDETELKARYDVSVQSTFVLLDSEGNLKQTWPFASGLRSAQDLYDAVNES